MNYIQTIIDSVSKTYMVKGLKFNHADIIKRISLYLNDQYVEPPSDDAAFWNLWTPRRVHFAKNYDIDTKDLMPEGIGETNIVQAWILKVKFQKWCRDNGFAITIDDTELNLGDYGSSVWKISDNPDVDGKKNIEICELNTLFFNPLAKTIRKENVVEIHELSESQIRDKPWENIDEAIRVAEKNEDTGKYKIYEYWGDIKKDKNFKFVNRITTGDSENAVVLYEDDDVEREDMPYYDFHLGPWQGTWLRIGGVQRLFKLQERANKLVNENAETSAIASLLLMRTANPDLHGENALRGAVSGLIVNDPTLEQVVMNNPAIANFIAELDRIEAQADRLCMTPNVVTGESTPSSIPFRSTVVYTNAAKSAFKMIRTRIGGEIGKIVLEQIMPELAKEWSRKDEIIEIAEDQDDIKFYDQSIVKVNKIKYAVNLYQQTGKVVSGDEWKMLDQVVQEDIERNGRKLKIPKGYFNFKYGIRINPTGESYDKQQQNDTMYNVNALTLQNPAWYNTPMAKQYLENNGIKWWKLSTEQQEQLMAGTQAGSAAPAQPKQDKLLSAVDSNV